MAKVYMNLGRRTNKYGVRIDSKGKHDRTHDGIIFASKRECNRYRELKMLEKAGEIRGLRRQPSFALMAPVVENGELNVNEGRIVGMRPVGEYRGDFDYEERRIIVRLSIYDAVTEWRRVVEDVKGKDTPMSFWKRRHVEIQYGITVKLT